MKLNSVAGLVGVLTLTALSGCDAGAPPAEEDATAAVQPAAPVEPAAASDAAVAVAAEQPALPAAGGAPAFAAIYPGGTPDAPIAEGVNGDSRGGMVTYTTQATPEQVIEFYKARAVEAGLETKVALAQGPIMSYAAGDGSGADLQVIAQALPDGGASVQLSWSASS